MDEARIREKAVNEINNFNKFMYARFAKQLSVEWGIAEVRRFFTCTKLLRIGTKHQIELNGIELR